MTRPSEPPQLTTRSQDDGPLEPRADRAARTLLHLVARAQRLEALPRTGWIVAGIERPESVAAHTFGVALIAAWLARGMCAAGVPVDVERVMLMALVHDMGEAMLTDLPWPVKQLLGPQAVAHAEHQAGREILGPSGSAWLEVYEAYGRRDSLEALVVKAADTIQMLAMARQYESQRRGDTERFWQRLDSTIAEVRGQGLELAAQVLEELGRGRAQGQWFANDFA